MKTLNPLKEAKAILRDLKQEHFKILKRIEELIQTEIPKKFNIFGNSMKNSMNGGANTQASAQASVNNSDKYNPEAYKLFYSYVKLGVQEFLKLENKPVNFETKKNMMKWIDGEIMMMINLCRINELLL